MNTGQNSPVQPISVPEDISREADTANRSHVYLRNTTIWDKFVLRTNLTGDKAKVTKSIKLGYKMQRNKVMKLAF